MNLWIYSNIGFLICGIRGEEMVTFLLILSLVLAIALGFTVICLCMVSSHAERMAEKYIRQLKEDKESDNE